MSIRRSTLQSIRSQIAPLILLATLALILVSVGIGGQVVSLQSPVSPVAPAGAPTQAPGALPGTSPLAPYTSPLVPEKPLVSAPIKLPRLFSPARWSSPWPWVGLGIVLFGGLAWALIVLLRRLEPGKSSSNDSLTASETGALPAPTDKAHSQEDEGEGEIKVDIR
jgi:hypothetical protein